MARGSSKKQEAAEIGEAPTSAVEETKPVEATPEAEATTGVWISFRPSPVYRTIPSPGGGQYAWHEGNGWECEVDVATAANLITYPSGTFRMTYDPPPHVVRQLADILGVQPRNIVLPGRTREQWLAEKAAAAEAAAAKKKKK